MNSPKLCELPQALCLDPGNTKAGWVHISHDDEAEGRLKLESFGIDANDALRARIRNNEFDVRTTRLVLETPRPRGMPTAGEEMETLIMIGRFIQEWSRLGGRWSFVFRQDVKLYLTGSPKAKDGNINQAIRDRFGGEQKPIKCYACKGKGWVGVGRPTCATCGGAKYERLPGPLFGVVSHAFAAMGVACWWTDHRHIQQKIINPGGRDPRAAKQTKPTAIKRFRTSKTLK